MVESSTTKEEALANAQPVEQLIGHRMQVERVRLGLTQARMAAALGVSRLTVLCYEAGRSSPDLTILVSAARDLPLDVTYLATGVRAPQTRLSAVGAALEVIRAHFNVSTAEEADLLRELYLKLHSDAGEHMGAGS
jgi:transcriptional regulator with XRE-family HTH domain